MCIRVTQIVISVFVYKFVVVVVYCMDVFVSVCDCSRYFHKICQRRSVGGVSKTLLTAVKSHIGTENNAVINFHLKTMR